MDVYVRVNKEKCDVHTIGASTFLPNNAGFEFCDIFFFVLYFSAAG